MSPVWPDVSRVFYPNFASGFANIRRLKLLWSSVNLHLDWDQL